jgi:hypothetical protein
MQFVTIDKSLIWQLEHKFYVYKDKEPIKEVENECGLEYHDIKEYEIYKELNIEDYYLYKIIDKEKFIFAVMKYNLNYLFVDPKLQS